MNFETRQRQAIEEVNQVLQKYGVALQPFLDAKFNGIFPGVRIVDVQPKEEVNVGKPETNVAEKKSKKGKK